jgi:hypothetical protein
LFLLFAATSNLSHGFFTLLDEQFDGVALSA